MIETLDLRYDHLIIHLQQQLQMVVVDLLSIIRQYSFIIDLHGVDLVDSMSISTQFYGKYSEASLYKGQGM